MEKVNMQDMQELQIILQLVDNIDIVVEKLEKAYDNRDATNFEKSKQEILSSYRKIQEILK
jgi:sigma54-dependent transcription regulator